VVLAALPSCSVCFFAFDDGCCFVCAFQPFNFSGIGRSPMTESHVTHHTSELRVTSHNKPKLWSLDPQVDTAYWPVLHMPTADIRFRDFVVVRGVAALQCMEACIGRNELLLLSAVRDVVVCRACGGESCTCAGRT
jgi:hypothetical protein